MNLESSRSLRRRWRWVLFGMASTLTLLIALSVVAQAKSGLDAVHAYFSVGSGLGRFVPAGYLLWWVFRGKACEDDSLNGDSPIKVTSSNCYRRGVRGWTYGLLFVASLMPTPLYMWMLYDADWQAILGIGLRVYLQTLFLVILLWAAQLIDGLWLVDSTDTLTPARPKLRIADLMFVTIAIAVPLAVIRWVMQMLSEADRSTVSEEGLTTFVVFFGSIALEATATAFCWLAVIKISRPFVDGVEVLRQLGPRVLTACALFVISSACGVGSSWLSFSMVESNPFELTDLSRMAMSRTLFEIFVVGVTVCLFAAVGLRFRRQELGAPQ